MKLVLFSDLHLDSQFSWLGVAGLSAQKRRQALRDTLLRIVRLAQEVNADAVLCGGDLYERERVTPDTVEFLCAKFAELQPIRVFIAPGNHDWYGPGSVYHRTPWSPNVHIFSESQLRPMEVAEGLLLWGAAHCAPAGTPDFLAGFKVEGVAIHLGLFHGSERGWLAKQGEGKEPHAPFWEHEVDEAGLSHAFLGHYHHPKDARRHTYPGNPDPLGFGEEGERGAVIVTVEGNGVVNRERRRVAVSQLHEITLDITGCSHQQDLRERVALQVRALEGLVRITLTGEVTPSLDPRVPGLDQAFPHLDGLQVRLGRVWAGHDLDHLREEQTVRGQFVRDVLAAGNLTEEQRQRVLLMGLRALAGQEDLEAV